MEKLKKAVIKFSKERNWQGYHSPKNLAMALSVEVAELVEIFQWMKAEESRNVDDPTLAHIEEEIGDIMIYLTNIANQYNLDPLEAARKKMIKNAVKYPA